MKRLKVFIALVAVLAMTFPMTVFAAPSPVAGTVLVNTPGKPGASSATIKMPTKKELQKLGDYINQNAASMGMMPQVLTSISIVAPADYKGGDIPTVLAAAGIPNGASNVFAYVLLANGKTVMLPCTVRNGYVGFVSPGFGTVSIVVLNPAAQTAANAGNGTGATAAVPATLH